MGTSIPLKAKKALKGWARLEDLLDTADIVGEEVSPIQIGVTPVIDKGAICD
jgi:hypothetical protein